MTFGKGEGGTGTSKYLLAIYWELQGRGFSQGKSRRRGEARRTEEESFGR